MKFTDRVFDVFRRGSSGGLPQKWLLSGGLVGVMVIMLLVGVISVYLDILRRTGVGEGETTEYGIWATYQLDAEAADLAYLVALEDAAPGTVSAGDILDQYNIFYSRVDILAGGNYRIAYRSYPRVAEYLEELEGGVYPLADLFDTFEDMEFIPRDTVAEIKTDTDRFKELSRGLLNETNSLLSRVREMESSQLSMLYNWSLVASLGTLGVLAIIIFGLVWVNVRNTRLRRDAEAGNRAKSTFLATMSHEIRTPLNGLIGMIEVLDGSDLSPAQARQVATARRSGAALLDIITDILDFSKLEHGQGDADICRVRLDTVMQAALDLTHGTAAKKGIEIKAEYPSIEIDTDQAKLRQVLFNLLGNAIKFTDSGSVTVRVGRNPENATMLDFSVIDTGIGIPADRMNALFKEFSQVDSTIRRRFGGTGLGLAISKRLVNLLGGTIAAASEEGKGSVFSFTIPGGDIKDVARASPADADPEVYSKGAARILIVEDNEVNREVAIALLEGEGVEIDCAEDGLVAQGMVENGRYDIIFMDMQMPVMDGLDATRRIRARGIETPIVGLTGNAFTTDRDACLEAGMNDYVAKPVTRAKIGGIMDKFLPNRESVRQVA